MEIGNLGELAKITDAEFFRNNTVAVGWPDANATAVYYERQKRSGYAKGGGRSIPAGRPVSLAMIARTLNYGREEGITISGRKYPAIPPRPFMDLARKNFEKKAGAILGKLLPLYASGRMSARQVLEFLGQKAADEIKESMRTGPWAPLSAVTKELRRHGGDQPLVDTGTLVNSVSFELRPKG